MKKTEFAYDINTVATELLSDPQNVISKAENIYFQQIKNVTDIIEDRKIIMLSGPSASGKTTTANKLCEIIQSIGHKCKVVSLDDFYLNRDELPIINGKPNAEVIEALNVPLILSVAEELKTDGKAYLPKYDFFTGKRIEKAQYIDIGSDGIVIFEGIHALNPQINSGMDKHATLTIYVSPHSDFAIDDDQILSKREMRFIRRLVRDSWSRNSTPQITMDMWPVVCESEDIFIRPFASVADVRINTTHSYEPFLLKKSAEHLLSQINVDSDHFNEAQRYLSKLQYFTADIPEDMFPKTSLLREFIDPDITVYNK